MYRVLVLFALFGALRAEEPCTCDQVTNDIEDLRRFLMNPEKVRASLFDVLPGELSPYACNCNKYRQRRSEIKVHPKLLVEKTTQTETPTTQTPETPTRTPKPFFSSAPPAKFFSSNSKRVKCAKKEPQLGRYRCATGLMRRGYMCIPDPCYSNH